MDLAPIEFDAAREIDPLPEAGWSPERRAQFLALLAETGNVRLCAARCGLSAESVYKLRRRDPLFARAWNAALMLARGHAEQVLADRAIGGIEEPIYYRGELVGVRRRFDTRLLLAHIARLDQLTADHEDDPARFDELLAIVAGEAVPAVLVGGDADLPPDFDRHVEAAVRAVRRAKEAELPYERARARDEERRRIIDAAARQARDAAGDAWTAWFEQACAAVDRLDAEAPSFRARTVSTVSTAALTAAETVALE